MGNTHDDVARRWVNRIMYPGRDALSSNNLLDWGDRIMSYGSHFEVARILRDRKGNPTAWLLNGNTYSVTTSRHQRAVRDAVEGQGLPVVTIPHAALDAAGIDLRTVQIVDLQSDWWTETVVTKEHLVGSWNYEIDYHPGGDYGGWQNSKTGEFVAKTRAYGESAPGIECDCAPGSLPGPWKEGWNWERERIEQERRDVHIRARHGVWNEVRSTSRNTGRKTAWLSTQTQWEIVDEPTAPLGHVFERTIRRHWLGGSLITAQVPYRARRKHADCGGTGVADEPWYTIDRNTGIGPLTKEGAQLNEDHWAWQRERFTRHGYWSDGGTMYEHEIVPYWRVDVAVKHTECRGCGGTGSTTVDRRRTAYFLSGFDSNETRPSYFFCELPPKVRPTTVEEALEALKPSAVKLAEEMGREVFRQGDIFAIPMPGVTLRELKAQGGRLEKRGNLLGTNHAASEVVYVGSQTYARGTMRHVPEWRRPDHRPLTLGKQWHMIVKNTVPVSS